MKKFTLLLSLLTLMIVGLQARAADIYLQTSAAEQVHVYAWDGANFGEWPGTALLSIVQTPDDNGYYHFEVADGASIIFNNGNGGAGNQTGNIVNLSAGAHYFTYPVNGNFGQYETSDPPVVITSYTIAGVQALMGVDWDPAATQNDMVLQADGTYKLVKEGVELAAGDYEYKVVGNHAWSIWEVPQQGNQKLPIAEDGKYNVTFTLTLGDENVLTANAELVEVTPQPEPKYVLHYGLNEDGAEWSTVEFAEGDEGKLVATAEFAENTEFVINNGDLWYGGAAAEGESFYLLHNEWCTNIPLTTENKVNFHINEAGTYTFTLTVGEEGITMDVNGFAAGVRGDITGDGVVDIADVNTIINMMLGKADKTAAADLTGDGAVDIADVNTVINIMAGK